MHASMAESHYVLGIDIGGTFTDVLAVDLQTGALTAAKVPTEPADLVEGITAGVSALDLELSQVTRIVHGSTTCTNALIEGKQARTGFIGTKGFSDEFDIQRMVRRWAQTPRAAIYDLHQPKPSPFVPRSLRREVTERTLHTGAIEEPLDLYELEAATQELIEEGIEALAICFLWSPVNARHEELAKDQVARVVPNGYVSISTEVAPVVREYERMVTTAVNASLLPVLGDYLRSVDQSLRARGFIGHLLLMQSHGGVSGPDRLRDRPVLTLRGGPVGGAVAAAFLARTIGRPQVISCDIGGTSCDTALILDFEVPIADETEVDYYPVKIPTADIRCIGAGGGSIARLDAGGAIRVGPESAGAVPGPACYGRGGREPTLTDANVVLGRIRASALTSGVELSANAARESMAPLAEWLDLSIEAVAHGIVTIAVANMADSIRLQTIARGHDPRELSLIAFGGAGPLHATLLAEACSIPEVLIPVTPGVFSSLGMLVADHGHHATASYLVALDEVESSDLEHRLRQLEDEASRQLSLDVGVVPSSVRRSAQMRYVLQEWEVPVELPTGNLDEEGLGEVRTRFLEAHKARYGFARQDRAIEFVTLAVNAVHAGPALSYGVTETSIEDTDGASGVQSLIIDPALSAVEVPVYRRDALRIGQTVAGPLVIVEPTSTTYVQPGWRASTDGYGNLIARAA